MRHRTIQPSANEGKETEHPLLAGYSEAERLLREGVDIVTGGFPCQDISFAGKGAGIQYDRATSEATTRSGLFGQVVRTLRLVRPRVALLENVAALLSRGMGTVCGELAEIGYNTEWDCISAADVGAHHLRERIWITATDTQSERCAETRELCERPAQRLTSGGEVLADTQSERMEGRENTRETSGKREKAIKQSLRQCSLNREWAVEPPVGRVANGIPYRVDRLKGLGNAIVPKIAEILGEAIAERLNNEDRRKKQQSKRIGRVCKAKKAAKKTP